MHSPVRLLNGEVPVMLLTILITCALLGFCLGLLELIRIAEGVLLKLAATLMFMPCIVFTGTVIHNMWSYIL